MNFYNFQTKSIDSTLIESVYKILNEQHFIDPLYFTQRQSFSFIKIKEKSKSKEECTYHIYQLPFCISNQDSNKTNNLWYDLNDYWFWEISKNETIVSIKSKRTTLEVQNLDTYKELKAAAKQSNIAITKEEIYEQLLGPYRQEKIKQWDRRSNRFRILYIWKYEGWDKQFTKTWNLLDHVRMHEGIKPYTCKICGKPFTQKGNLKKHNIVQHSSVSLIERKKFKCDYCDRSYTERYNLTVIIIYFLLLFNHKICQNSSTFLSSPTKRSYSLTWKRIQNSQKKSTI